MQFIKPDVNVDFVGKRYIAFTISGLMILASIISLVVKGGPRYGIDFAGGSLIQVRFAKPTTPEAIKKGLVNIGLTQTTVQRYGPPANNEYLIRASNSVATDKTFTDKIKSQLTQYAGSAVEIRRIEMVGPKVGKDLREKALFAIFYALLFIAIYISGRFELKWMTSAIMAACLAGAVALLALFNVSIPFLLLAALLMTLVLFWILDLRYAMGAIVALIHDVTITIGLFSLTNKDMTLTIVAALLTIIGYSLNDTIIVYDRIRENLKKFPKRSLEETLNRSVNETLSRTILTSGTTLVAVLALLILGGGIIHNFAFAMTAGIIVGTYSSVYVASPILMAWRGRSPSRK